ncbi:MAG TPA: HD domain-containing protein [Longimicrobiales bacterium]|nr:HD domain-containing protein [Longimicrobiales bacterium]
MNERPLPGPRDWIAGGPFPWPPAASVRPGDIYHACYFLVSVQTLRTKTDKPYLRLQLQDVHGALEGRVWEMAEQIADSLRDGMYVGVRGRVEVFNGERQLKVEEIAQIHVGLDDLEHFMPRSPRDPEEMDRELAVLIASVQDDALRALLETMLGAGTNLGAGFRLAPAAKYNHHAYLGGLIEHTLSIAHVCDMLAAHYEPHIDRDLLITGALLHDVGKVREIGARAGFPYTDEGKLLGHIVLGMQMVVEAAESVRQLTPQRLTLLQHLVASHQGRYEWQSPREPRTLEAYILHYADDLDAKMQHAISMLATVAGPAGWTGYDRSLGRELYRHRPGADDASETAYAREPARAHGRGRVAEERQEQAPHTGDVAQPGVGKLDQRQVSLQDAEAASLDEGVEQTAAAEAPAEGRPVTSPTAPDAPEPDEPPQPEESADRRNAPPDTLDLFD